MKADNLLETIGEFDDRHIRAGEFESLFGKPKKAKRLRFTVIAACAAVIAALSLIVGARIDIKEQPSILHYRVGDSEPVSIELPLKAKKLTIPEMSNPPFEDDWYSEEVKSPDEYYEVFGVEPLINENVTFRDDCAAAFQILEPMGLVGYYQVLYLYYMQDDNIGENYISFKERHFSDPDHFGLDISLGTVDENETAEFLTLNDGSPCVIIFYAPTPLTNYSLGFSVATFVYNGSLYRLHIFETDEEPGTIEKAKIVLSDLGVL